MVFSLRAELWAALKLVRCVRNRSSWYRFTVAFLIVRFIRSTRCPAGDFLNPPSLCVTKFDHLF
jgi:hypothetical protein